MIITDREHVLDYLGLNKNLDAALMFIAGSEFLELEDGEHLINGRDVRVKLQHIHTKPADEAELEAHNSFADIQMVLDGAECIGWCFRKDELTEIGAHPERDVWFYEGSYSIIELRAGELAILFPGDIHAPALSANSPTEIRKAVFKIRLD